MKAEYVTGLNAATTPLPTHRAGHCVPTNLLAVSHLLVPPCVSSRAYQLPFILTRLNGNRFRDNARSLRSISRDLQTESRKQGATQLCLSSLIQARASCAPAG